MQMRQRIWILGALTAATLLGCVGAAGKDGKDGKDGAPGQNAPVPTASIAYVSKSELLAGRTTSFTVVGLGTRFDSTSKLSLGAGVTVDTLKVLSEVALSATVTVSDTAELGNRTVTVTTGDQTIKGNDLISIVPAIMTAFENGTLAQGVEGTLRVETSAPQSFSPVYKDGALVVGNVTLTSEDAISMAPDVKWVSNQAAEVAIAVSPFISAATIKIEYSNKSEETFAIEFAPTPNADLTVDTPVNIELSKTQPLTVLSVASVEKRGVTVALKLGTGSKLQPRLRAYVAGNAKAVATANGTSLYIPPADTSQLYKVVVSDLSGDLAETAEAIEAKFVIGSNNCVGTECIVSWTFDPPLATPLTSAEVLSFPFAIDTESPCVLKEATGSWKVTHEWPSDIRFGFIFPDGTETTSLESFRPTQSSTATGVQTSGTATKTDAPWAGATANGQWTLKIRDMIASDVGVVDSFELKLTCEAGP